MVAYRVPYPARSAFETLHRVYHGVGDTPDKNISGTDA